MKRAMIIFLILFILSATIPLFAIVKSNQKEEQKELVTVFSSMITLSSEFGR